MCVQLIQECLSPAERRQIVEDLRDQLPDICQSIDNLNTALSFLKALGGETSTSLHEFMSSTLKMKRTLYSGKVETIKNGKIAGDWGGWREKIRVGSGCVQNMTGVGSGRVQNMTGVGSGRVQNMTGVGSGRVQNMTGVGSGRVQNMTGVGSGCVQPT